jgi:hypothetical protein
MEAVQIWPESLLKELAGHRPPIHLHRDAAAAHGDEHIDELDWSDEP